VPPAWKDSVKDFVRVVLGQILEKIHRIGLNRVTIQLRNLLGATFMCGDSVKYNIAMYKGLLILFCVTLMLHGCGPRRLQQPPTMATLEAVRPCLAHLAVDRHYPGYIVPLAVSHVNEDVYCVVMGYTPDRHGWNSESLMYGHAASLSSWFSFRGEGLGITCAGRRSGELVPMTRQYAVERIPHTQWSPMFFSVQHTITDRNSSTAAEYCIWGAFWRIDGLESCDTLRVQLRTQDSGKLKMSDRWVELRSSGISTMSRRSWFVLHN
jgi:hypothetical protein